MEGTAIFSGRMTGLAKISSIPRVNLPLDLLNLEVLHEHLFFEDGGTPANYGYFQSGVHPDSGIPGAYDWDCYDGPYDDCIMRSAVAKVFQSGQFSANKYCIAGPKQNNCQDWADAVRKAYHELK